MPSINYTEQEIFRELRQFIIGAVYADGSQVIQAAQNNQPLPHDAVVMNILSDSNRDTSANAYDSDTGKAYVTTSVVVRIQLDFYGNLASERSRIISTLWRNFYGTDNLTAVQPLYVNSRIRQPYINEASRYEDRYILDLTLQYNPVVEHDQDFIDSVSVTVKQLNSENEV